MSLPWPSCLEGLGLRVPCVAAWVVVGGGLLFWHRRRSGSLRCSGQACHRRPHLQVHCLTNKDLLQELHQTRWSSVLGLKAGLVPSTWCGHLGHLKKIVLGKLGVLLMVGLSLLCAWLLCCCSDLGRLWLGLIVSVCRKSACVVEVAPETLGEVLASPWLATCSPTTLPILLPQLWLSLGCAWAVW